MKNKILRNTLIYFALFLGFVYLYLMDIDVVLYPDETNQVKSKVDFVYQQF